MAGATLDRDESEGVVFVREDDGSVTAKDLETGLARGGDTRAEALAQLAEVLELHEGGGEPVTDEDLREWGLDPDDFDTKELPEFMQ
jgi:predicted RNase H-like HicB family nuclease